MNNKIKERLIEIIKTELEFGDLAKLSIEEMIAIAILKSNLLFNPETDVRAKFNIGQEVWFVYNDKIFCGKIFGYLLEASDEIGYTITSYDKRFEKYSSYRLSSESIFSTEIEAQQAIKDRE